VQFFGNGIVRHFFAREIRRDFLEQKNIHSYTAML